MGVTMGLKLNRHARMGATERSTALTALVREAKAPRNGQARRLDSRIKEFEVRLGMTSDTMAARWKRGELPDTAEFAEWMILIAARDGRG
ncbi:MAG: hypothetical protein IT370_22765 [Deltaproteobacteria bacterium]|nr:hypothetical protein [Deltaproteobacteria bacterium]